MRTGERESLSWILTSDLANFLVTGEDDNLLSHEPKHGLPKTPYPTTEEQDARIQNAMFAQ